MKFFSGSLLALLFTSAMANVINNPTTNFASLLGGNMNSLIGNTSSFAITQTTTTNNAGEECQKVVIEKYTVCIQKATFEFAKMTGESDIVQVCPTYEDTSCKALINEDINLPADCNDKGNELKQTLELFRFMYYAGCAKDEQGNYCPSNKIISGQEQLTDAQLKEQSCKSEKCAAALEEIIDLGPSINSIFGEMNFQNETMPMDQAYFENLKCEEKSAATTKVWSFSVLSLALYAMMMVLF